MIPMTGNQVNIQIPTQYHMYSAVPLQHSIIFVS